MEDQRYLAFLLSLVVLLTAVMNSGPVMAHVTSGAEMNSMEEKKVKTEDQDARDYLLIGTCTQSTSNADFLEGSGEFITTHTCGGDSSNGTTVEATLDQNELEQAIHEVNMKVLLSVGIFLIAVAGTALSIKAAKMCFKMSTRIYRGWVPPTPVDPESPPIVFSDFVNGGTL